MLRHDTHDCLQGPVKTPLRRTTLTIGAVALMLNTACYAYMPVAGGAVPATAQLVRIRLTSEGTSELARFLGPRVVVVEGTYSKAGDDGALVVGPDWVELSDGQRTNWSGEGVVTIPLKYTQGVEARTFDRRKTTLATVFTVVAVVALALIAFNSTGAKGSPPSSGPPGQPAP
jgi:hypothetical protein